MFKLGSRLLLLLVSTMAAVLLVCCGVNAHIVGSGSGSADGEATPPLNEHLVITDSGNNRVLIYNPPLTTDESASVVLGQPDFTHGFPNQGNGTTLGIVGANTLRPSGAEMDAAGDLWVADGGNCRVLEFKPPFTSDMNASLVIGLPQLTTQPPYACILSENPTANGMDYPVAIAFDRGGDLWIADQYADRVTEYRPPFRNGMAATLAIGQPDLNNNSQCNGGSNPNYILLPTSTSLCEPTGIAFDSAGDLWVADGVNGRVLEYIPPFSTGMAASLDLGVPAALAFSVNGCEYGWGGTTANSVCFPTGLKFDASGDLWVADFGNGRVLEFVPPFVNGMAAVAVIGKANFFESEYSDGMLAPTASNLLTPNSLSFDSKGDMVVGDLIGDRVLIYAPPFSNGMAATLVLGQPNMTSSNGDQCSGGSCGVAMPTANTLSNPSVGAVF